jgi:peptide/nickel transport system permease protein
VSAKNQSAKFPPDPTRGSRFHGSTHRFWRLVKLTLASMKESKLGLVGIGIIAMFGIMAMLAPMVAPYKPSFLAPDQDVFEIKNYTLSYPPGEYNAPCIGPTTPTFTTINGGLWVILASEDGRIYMDFAKTSFTNATPFEAGNASIQINITDLGLHPPLTHVQYVVPGRDINLRAEEQFTCGILIFMADTTFVALDPFAEAGPEVMVQRELGFKPTWLVQDPASSGDMYTVPLQQARYVGVVRIRFGPYRYIAAANESHITVFNMEYLWNDPGVGDFIQVLDANMTVTAEPLTYQNLDYPNASCILVPTAGQLAMYNLSGGLVSSLPLAIQGEPANVSGPIGYSRTTYPPIAFVPLKSANHASVGFLSLINASFYTTFEVPKAGATVEARPAPSKDQSVMVAANLASPEAEGKLCEIYKLAYDGTADQNFQAGVDERLTDIFFVVEVNKLFGLGESGLVYAGSTVSGAEARTGVNLFYSIPSEYIAYVGTFSGTKYGAMTSGEVNGLFFDEETGALVVFQLVGTIRAPLPPGKYASGHTYILGTDNVGHDILTHLIYGSRVAFLVGVLSAFFAVFFGTMIGLISGYYGGWTDTILMRATDIILVLPTLPIVLILTAIMGPNIWNIILIIALLGWPGIARVIRAQTLSLKERPFVDAARVAGSSDTKIIIKHISPNVLPFTFLYMTLLVAGAIITEAALSFLGLGDPKAVTWGIMLSTIQTSGNTLSAWWWLLPPGVAITVLSLGFYLVGRAVDEIVNPRLRRR